MDPLFTLFIVFLVLKLCDVIDWSWWWVTAPLWIGYIVAILLTGIFIANFPDQAGTIFKSWTK